MRSQGLEPGGIADLLKTCAASAQQRIAIDVHSFLFARQLSNVKSAFSPLAKQPHESRGGEVGNQERRVAASGDPGHALSCRVAAPDGAFHGGGPSCRSPISS